MKIFSGSSNKPLAEKIANKLNLELSPVEIHVFPDGERRVKLNDEVVDEDTVVVQSTATPVDQNYMELFFIVDALKRSGARSITAVIPYLGYQRQDHVFREGESVSLQVMIKILESLRVNKVTVLDLHSIKIPEFFHIPLGHLSALPLFAEEVKNSGWGKTDSVLVSPDLGGLRRINKMSELLEIPWVATVKDRQLDTGNIEISSIEGERKDIKKRAIMIDDMISSGRTIVKSAELLQKNGVSEFNVFVTHPIFSQDASEFLQNSIITKIYVTDSVYVPEEKRFPKLKILSVAHLIAENLKA